MTIKELKELLSMCPDDFEIGHTKKEDHRAHNLHPECWVDVFYTFNEYKVDLKNKEVVLS